MAALPANFNVFDNSEAVSEAAAGVFREIIATSPRDRIAVCLSGGSTPERLYERLREQGNRHPIPWHRVHWFWGDERFVPMMDPRSNAAMAWGAFLARAPGPLDTVHVVPLTANTVEHSAALYEEGLKRFYGASELDPARPLFDLVLLGLGEDGHTASLFPGSPALDERERWVASVEEAALAPFVPRVTLTLPALESAREVLFLVSGAAKRKALARLLAGEDLPAGRVRPTGQLRWLVDRAALPRNDA